MRLYTNDLNGIMKCKKIGFFVAVLCSISSYAQSPKADWSALVGYGLSYSGTNVHAEARRVGQKGHVFDLGLLYNLSDGFTNRPVPGVRLFYGYQILKSERWDVVTGLSYVREKPLKIVNIQMLNYATSTSLKLNEKLSFRTQIGYGVALERAASAGAFSQSNNISGALSLGCAYKI